MRLTSPIRDSKGEFPISTSISNTRKALTGSSSLWSGLKNPRIVRVSRAFGGKDRHSKVTTIRGLRDRRVRLSVPTAIQLYDLQARLGLNQPSKAVDWLLSAAQHAIDKLPPLEFPAVNFLQFRQHSETSLKAWNSSSQKDHNLNHEGLDQDPGNINTALYQDIGINNSHPSFYHDHLPNSRAGCQALRLHSNNGMPYASSYHWDPTNRNYFTQFGILSSQVEATPASALSSNYYTTAATPFGRTFRECE